MLEVILSNKFKKDWKIIKKRGYNLKKFEVVLEKLLRQEILEEKYKDHELIGNYKGHRECHITPDWLLIYYISDTKLVLTLTRTGTHSDLF